MLKRILPLVALFLGVAASAQTYQLSSNTRCSYNSQKALTCSVQIPDVNSSVFFGFNNQPFGGYASPVIAYQSYEANQPTKLNATDFYPAYSGTLNPPQINFFQCSPDPNTGGCTGASTLYLSYSDLVNNTTTYIELQQQYLSTHCGGKGTQTCKAWFWVIINGTYSMSLPTHSLTIRPNFINPMVWVDSCGLPSPTGRIEPVYPYIPQWDAYCYPYGGAVIESCTWYGFPWDPNGGYGLRCTP